MWKIEWKGEAPIHILIKRRIKCRFFVDSENLINFTSKPQKARRKDVERQLKSLNVCFWDADDDDETFLNINHRLKGPAFYKQFPLARSRRFCFLRTPFRSLYHDSKTY